MKKYIALALLAIAVTAGVVGCRSDSETAGAFRDEIFYFKDYKTGLCFAGIQYVYVGALTVVPCEKVEQHLR